MIQECKGSGNEVNGPKIMEVSRGWSHNRKGSAVRNFQGQVDGERQVQAGSEQEVGMGNSTCAS